MEKREIDFRAALPSHISPEHFMRVVMTAVQQNSRLLDADRRSFISAALKAAQDGLLPDGREGALVPHRDKSGTNIVQWMPMTAGIRKKIRNSGEIATWDCNVICENDEFTFELGDEPFIHHKPILGNRGKLIGAYSVATLKSGEKSRDVMSAEEIYKIRDDRSEGWKQFRNGKIRSTPWSTDEGEMFKKTVARRHSKVLPMSTDMIGLFSREDENNTIQDQAPQRPPSGALSTEALKSLGYDGQAVPGGHTDPDTGEFSPPETYGEFPGDYGVPGDDEPGADTHAGEGIVPDASGIKLSDEAKKRSK